MLARARTHNEVGRFELAAVDLDAALTVLESVPDGGGAWLAARVRITLAWTTVELEGLTAALSLIDEARATADAMGDPLLLALSHIQEANIRERVGDRQGSLAALDRVDGTEDVLDPSQRCALHINRGLSHLGLGESAAATRALTVARDLAAEHGLLDQEFKARHNLGCVAFVDGDLPRALVLMREADSMDAEVSRDRARLDHAEVLLAAGLVDQARSALEDTLVTAREDGHRLEVGEISLRLARCDVLVGDLDGARDRVRAATAAYRTRQADALVADAELVRAAVDIAVGHDLPGLVTSLTRRNDHPVGRAGAPTAGDLEALRLEAEARLLLGDATGARRRLASLERADATDPAAAAGGTSSDTLAGRLHELLIRARLAEADDRPQERADRVAEGNRLLASHQVQSSSLDVRAALALHGRRLAGFDVGRALRQPRPADALDTVERWRAVSHRIDAVSAPEDPELGETIRELRLARRAAADDPRDGAFARRVVDLERRISEREWALAVGAPEHRAPPAATAEELVAGAGGRDATLVELFELDGLLHAVRVTAGDVRRFEVGRADEVATLVTRLRRDLRARALIPPSSPMAATLARATTSSLAEVDRVLSPCWPGSGRVVVAPSQSLVAMPWALLSSLRSRPVTVAPSLTRWLRGPGAVPRPRGRRAVCALHGPGLKRAAAEIDAVHAAWRTSGYPDADSGGPDDNAGARPAPGVAATSRDVVGALASARVVHLAAHGVHEAQSPLFSSVQMIDGPAFAHEFPRPVAAEHVALSSCDVGQFSSRAGDEPLGLAMALVSLGAHSVLGAVAPVGEDLSAEAMVAYHRRLATGVDAAEAWAGVVSGMPDAGVFTLYGSDWSAADAPLG